MPDGATRDADQPHLQRLALQHLEGTLTASERGGGVVYLDATVRSPGPARLGPAEMEVHDPSCVLFVDGKPGANWTHACRYLLMAVAGGEMTSVPAEQPPVFGPLPPSWSVLWRAPGVEDWRLLPLSSAPS